MSDFKELEIKLKIDQKYIKKLLSLSLLTSALVADSVETKVLDNRYYDSDDFRLCAAGIAYRVRKVDDSYIATLKTAERSESGFSERNEYNVEISDDKPSADVFSTVGMEATLNKVLGGAQLSLLFKSVVKREIRLLQITEDTLLEMAVDKGKIIVGKRQDKIDEIEFEIVKGKKADLFAFVGALAEAVPIFIEPKSKFERGINLLNKTGGFDSIESRGIKLAKDSNVEDEFKKLIRYNAGVILETQNALGALHGLEDADRLLLNKVKRLRALLEFLQPLADEITVNYFRERLDEFVQPLQRLYCVKRVNQQWRIIEGKIENLSKSTLLRETLDNYKENEMKVIEEQYAAGLYAKILFQLLSWVENTSWDKAEYVKMEQFATCRFKEWHKDLLAWSDVTEDKEIRIIGMRRLVERMLLVRRNIKIGTLDKKSFGSLKELHRELKILCFDIYGQKEILKLIQGSTSKLLYRDVGLLLGWRLSAEAETELVVHKAWQEVRNILKNKNK